MRFALQAGGDVGRCRLIYSAVLTAVPLMAVYLVTMPRELTWSNWGGDGGELITAAVTLGVPHPPGYPLYVLLGWIWQWLPVEPAAFRYHLFSAATMAAAAGILAALVTGGDQNKAVLPGIGTGFLFGCAQIPWSQGIIAEVYALNMVVVALFFYWTVRGSAFHRGFGWGLGLTTHLSSLLLIPLLLSRKNSHSHFTQITFGTLLGLSPSLLLFIPLENAPVRWGAGGSLADWWWMVSAQPYSPNSFNLPFSFWAPRLIAWSPLLLAGLTPLMWPLIVASQFQKTKGKEKRSLWTAEHKRLDLFVFITACCYLIYSFFYQTDDALVFTIPAWFFLAYLMRHSLRQWRFLAVVLPLLLLLLNYPLLNLREERGVRPYVEAAFQETPQESLLTTRGDPTIFSLWYFQHVAGLRPDLFLVDYHLFAFEWYRNHLREQYPLLAIPTEDDWTAFIAMNQKNRQVCTLEIITTGSDYQLYHSCEGH